MLIIVCKGGINPPFENIPTFLVTTPFFLRVSCPSLSPYPDSLLWEIELACNQPFKKVDNYEYITELYFFL